MKKNINKLIIYQAKSGKIEFRGDFSHETIWGSLNQIAELFGRDKSVISRHIKNISASGELSLSSTVAKIATVQNESGRDVIRNIDYYNLDMILSIGYRVDSKQATAFRIWATKILKQHIVDGFTIDKKRIGTNYEKFMRAVGDVKALLPTGNVINTKEVLELINAFANTWFSLDAYDKDKFPKQGITKKKVNFTSDELLESLREFRKDLISRKQATSIFGQEKNSGAVSGIVGNVFQAFGGNDVYLTVEEKAVHLFYFMIKNHPFTDGNKRSGAFSFIWFLRKGGVLRASLSPEALTALTLLVAESNPSDKEKIVGLVLLLLRR